MNKPKVSRDEQIRFTTTSLIPPMRSASFLTVLPEVQEALKPSIETVRMPDLIGMAYASQDLRSRIDDLP